MFVLILNKIKGCEEMGRKIIVTCDCCGTDIDGKLYFTVNREVLYDKQKNIPTYFCSKCFKEIKLVSLLLDLDDMSKKVY